MLEARSMKILTTRLSTVAVAALLAACSFIPKLDKPALPVADSYPGQPAGAATGPAAADVPWQSFFADARLKRLIQMSLESNRDLRLAVLAIDQARAQLQLRRADELPTVGAGLNASRAPGVTGTQVNSFQAGFQISAWEIDFFGRIRALSESARAQLLGTEEARKAVQIALVSSVAQAYLALQSDDAQLEVTRQTLTTREDSLRLTKLKFDNGVSSELDLRQAESLLEGARVTLAQTTRQRALDENALTLLIGRPLPTTDLPQPLPLGSAAAMTDLPAGLPSDLLTRRPDVRQAEQQMVAANANIGAARAAFFPRISLTASAGVASNQLSGLFDNGKFAYTVAPSLLLPIFDAGRNQANLESAKVAREVATVQYEKAIQTAFREVSDALAGRATLGEQLRAQRAQAAALETTYRLADLRYRSGAASYLDALDAQRSLFAAQLAVVQTQALELQNRIVLYKVLGGGWTDSPPPVAAAAASAPR